MKGLEVDGGRVLSVIFGILAGGADRANVSSSSLRVEAARSRFLAVGVVVRAGLSLLVFRGAFVFGGAREAGGAVGVSFGEAALVPLPNLSFNFGGAVEGLSTGAGVLGWEVNLSLRVGRCDIVGAKGGQGGEYDNWK